MILNNALSGMNVDLQLREEAETLFDGPDRQTVSEFLNPGRPIRFFEQGGEFLQDEGFLPLLDTYQQKELPGLHLLDNVTWGQLATRYGDKENDEVYYLYDLPEHKWAAAYLREKLC